MTRRPVLVFAPRRRAPFTERARRLMVALSRWGCRLRGHATLVDDHVQGRPVYRCLRCFDTWPRVLPLGARRG